MRFLLAGLVLASVAASVPGSAAIKPPSGDDANSPTQIDVPTTIKGSVRGATMQRGEPRSCVQAQSLWYSFTVATPTPLMLGINGIPERLGAALFAGTGIGSLRPIDCTNGPSVNVILEPGERYLVQVGAFSPTQGTGAFELSLLMGRWVDSWEHTRPLGTGAAAYAGTDAARTYAGAMTPAGFALARGLDRGKQGGASSCVVGPVGACVGAGPYAVGDDASLAVCGLPPGECAAAAAPNLFAEPAPDAVGFSSYANSNFNAGSLSLRASGSRLGWTFESIACVSATRHSIVRGALIVLSESGCLLNAGYRFDPLTWRATAEGTVAMTTTRDVYRRVNGKWETVSFSVGSTRQGTMSLAWKGFGEASPAARYAYPSVGVCYWPPGCVYPGYAGMKFSKAGVLTGSIRFPGLKALVRVPRGVTGEMGWGLPFAL